MFGFIIYYPYYCEIVKISVYAVFHASSYIYCEFKYQVVMEGGLEYAPLCSLSVWKPVIYSYRSHLLHINLSLYLLSVELRVAVRNTGRSNSNSL